MKKRILIVNHYMEIGGAERSLLGLLNAIDTKKYDVDLFIHSHRGEFMKGIPSYINLLPEEPKYATLLSPLLQVFFKGYLDIFLARLLAKFKYEFFLKRIKQSESIAVFQYMANCTTPLLPSLKKFGEYDLAISFMNPHNVVLDKVLARKKIAWIHTDYSVVHVNRVQELKIWRKYDYIISISDKVTDTFLQIFPELKSKIVLIENILSPAFVREQADILDVSEEMQEKDGIVKICSVGRFTSAKNFDNIPWICKLIVEQGIKIRWYLIGYGGEEQLIREQIKKSGMEKVVVILGKRDNPYPYMKACDIYIQPSRYEGKSVTVREAQMLYKPVIITDYPTAKSQIVEGRDGVIVPMDNEGCAKKIVEIIHNTELQNLLISYLQGHDYGNEKEIP